MLSLDLYQLALIISHLISPANAMSHGFAVRLINLPLKLWNFPLKIVFCSKKNMRKVPILSLALYIYVIIKELF